MQHQVQLPAGRLIDYGRFCRVIAQAICPAGEQGLEGIDCIVGKQRTFPIAMPAPVCAEEKLPVTADSQRVLQSDDDLTLDEQRTDQLGAAASSQSILPPGNELNYVVVDLTLPYELTEDDRRVMVKLLARLPVLRYPMSEEDAAAFMSAYAKLPNRPAWEPVLITAATIERRKAEQDEVMHAHQKALQDELAHGRLVAVDASHAPVPRLAFGAFIPREQAIAYLDRCGIWHSDKKMGVRLDAPTQVPVIHQEQPDEKQNDGGKTKCDAKRRRDIVAHYYKLKGQNDDYCLQTAQKFGISTSRVRQIVRDDKLRQEEVRTDLLVVKKRK